jgi:hypothetical protein
MERTSIEGAVEQIFSEEFLPFLEYSSVPLLDKMMPLLDKMPSQFN